MRVLALTLTFTLGFGSCARSSAQTRPAPQRANAAGRAPSDVPAVGSRDLRSDDAWRRALSPLQYRVLRQQGTEAPFSGPLWNQHAHGTYVCAGCGAPLFSSDDKFDSGTGWPSYTRPIADGRVASLRDVSHGMVRTEVRCARCDGHLGHVFDDGPPPTGQRFCINSAALSFVPRR